MLFGEYNNYNVEKTSTGGSLTALWVDAGDAPGLFPFFPFFRELLPLPREPVESLEDCDELMRSGVVAAADANMFFNSRCFVCFAAELCALNLRSSALSFVGFDLVAVFFFPRRAFVAGAVAFRARFAALGFALVSF